MKRQVTVELRGDAWLVLYVGRRKHQRYGPASFYAKEHTRADVENWIKNNSKLELQPEQGHERK